MIFKNTGKKDITILTLLGIAALLLTLAVSGNGFFWDSILLSSRYASWFYNNGLFKFMLPDTLDAVHPPTFGLYLAIWWKIFGRTLLVSHMAILPFIWGIIWQLYRLVKYVIPEKFVWPALILVLADVSLLGQCTQVSPDVALVFFFFWAVNSVLFAKNLQLALSSFFLAFVSVRGMFAVFVVFFFDLYYHRNNFPSDNWFRITARIIRYYLPAGILVFLFLGWHYLQKGWILPPSDTRWAGHYSTAGLKGIIYNILILGWRMADFGRIFLWIAVPVIITAALMKKVMADHKFRMLLWLFIIFMLVNAPYLLFFRQPIGHRYLIPAYLLFALWIAYTLFKTEMQQKLRWTFYGILLAGLLSGNCWIYPESIAKGWDSTPAHLPYYKLRAEMIQYIDENKIPVSTVGSDFPNNSKFDDIDLKGRTDAFPEKDLKSQQYIFYSNIFNGFSDAELNELETQWIIEKEYRKCGVFVRLYHKSVSE